jgi:hypothetical protein
MSAIWGRTLYDGCNNEQQLNMSVQPGMYNVFNHKFENMNNSTVDLLPCNTEEKQKMGCQPCNYNSNANINYVNDHYAKKIVDIEADLKLYTKPTTRCANGKFQHSDQTNNVVVNPFLCDRSIVPTNMKMPTKSGF